MKIAALVLSGILCASLMGFEPESKTLMNEDFRNWAKEQTKNLLKKGKSLGFDEDDILPEHDKGKKFHAPALEKSPTNPTVDPAVKEIEYFFQKSIKKELLEGTEPFLQLSSATVENPEKEFALTVLTKTLPEEEKIETCQEAGCYQISFSQRLEVEVTPEVKEKKKICGGHRLVKEFYWKTDAKDYVAERNKALAKDSRLAFHDTYIAREGDGWNEKYGVLSEWRHKDNEASCSAPWKEEIVQPRLEKEFWRTDFPDGLSAIEANPHCRFLFPQVVEGPGERTVKGFSVFRTVWARNLLFSCEPNADSPCAKLRQLGGVLLKKKCLRENPMGECDVWQKTYDMGGKAASQEQVYQFKDQEIWGSSGFFEKSYEKNQDFSMAAALLGIFADVKKEIEGQGSLKEENIRIFQGEPLQCSCSFLSGELFDCCKKMEGLAISAYLAKCNSEEVALVEKRESGKCHFIGSKKEVFGTKTSKVFCCFPTKLSRVVQEQGRSQLGIHWGLAESPDCRGLSLEEITHLDFSSIDLSEVVEDFAIDKEDLLKKVKTTISHLQTNGAKQGSFNTQTMMQKEKEQVLHGN